MPAVLPGNAIQPRSRAEWRRWLERNHARGEGVWFVMYKVAATKGRMDYDAAVEEALSFGWIDSRTRALDDKRSMLWMSPRRARTGWSKANKARVARLLADGRMAPAGLAKVEAARADGSWTLLDAVESLEVPDDLAKALAASKGDKHFTAFPPGVRKQLLEWVRSARKAETRTRRVSEIARLAAMNIRANQWMKKPHDATSR